MHLADRALNVADPLVIENARTNYRIERRVSKWQRANISLSNIVQATLSTECNCLWRQIDSNIFFRISELF